MKKETLVKFKIKVKGKPIINHGIVGKKYKDLALLYFDLTSKYCQVGGIIRGGVPAICVETTKDSLHLDKRAKLDFTMIELPEYDGWIPILGNIGRYTLTVLLIKDIN